jgi:dihydrodipicolinate reductase
MTKIIIAGAKGRMGAALLRCAETMPAITVSGRIDWATIWAPFSTRPTW